MSDTQGNLETTSSDSSELGGFAIYSKSLNSGSEQRELQAVKNGFSWPAFFFGAIWAWVKGMVGIGFGLLFLAIFVNVVGKIIQLNEPSGGGLAIDLLISLGVMIWIGSSGNKWRKSSLEEKGYKLVEASVPGSSPSEAIQYYNQSVQKEHEEEESLGG